MLRRQKVAPRLCGTPDVYQHCPQSGRESDDPVTTVTQTITAEKKKNNHCVLEQLTLQSLNRKHSVSASAQITGRNAAKDMKCFETLTFDPRVSLMILFCTCLLDQPVASELSVQWKMLNTHCSFLSSQQCNYSLFCQWIKITNCTTNVQERCTQSKQISTNLRIWFSEILKSKGFSIANIRNLP